MVAYDAIFFDFDGVLVESTDIKIRAFRRLYQDHGDEVVEAVVAHHVHHGGVSRRKKIRYCHKQLLGIRLTESELDDLARQFSNLVVSEVVACDDVPGSKALLDRLTGHVPLFVISGTPHEELVHIVEHRGMPGHFVEVRGSPPSKVPHIRELLDRHGLKAERVLFVGDAMTDYNAATNCGLAFLGRVHDGHPNPFPPGTATVSNLTGLVV